MMQECLVQLAGFEQMGKRMIWECRPGLSFWTLMGDWLGGLGGED